MPLKPIPVAEKSKARSAYDPLLGLRVRMPPGAWLKVSCDCCVLSGRGLCDGLNTRPEECVCVTECYHEASITKRLWPFRGHCANEKT